LQTNDIEIRTIQGSNEPLAADKLVFQPSINSYTSDEGKITFSSEDDFTIYHLQHSINFRVAAAIDID
jgi:hypothetical protein